MGSPVNEVRGFFPRERASVLVICDAGGNDVKRLFSRAIYFLGCPFAGRRPARADM